MLKLVFNVSNDDQGSNPDDISGSVETTYGATRDAKDGIMTTLDFQCIAFPFRTIFTFFIHVPLKLIFRGFFDIDRLSLLY